MNDASSEGIALQAEAEAAATRAHQTVTRRKWLGRLAIVVLVAGAIWLGWYVLVGRNYVSTDNAYVNAEVAQVTPLIAGTVTEVRVKDTQAVKRGDILMVLDPANARIALAQAEAELANAARQFRKTVATNSALSAEVSARAAGIAQARAQLAAAQAEAEKTSVDLQRRQELVREGIVSAEDLTAARKAHAAAGAAIATARAAIAQAQANRSSAQGQFAANDALVAGSSVAGDPGVRAAQARLEAARLDLERTVIRAPVDGVVTRRQVQLGQRVTQGQAVMTIVPIGQVYIDANFKERQLDRVRVGMPAEVTADIYGSNVIYHGKVAGISGGTGASMAMIPAQNATGNWIKVVQRLPVRIELDPKELAAHPLRIGLSTEVEIDVSGN
ncbi:MAG: EmrA/EmrK family multidrug efflux transporter periplasmic adaptor subunit [Novosphingobium sp.]